MEVYTYLGYIPSWGRKSFEFYYASALQSKNMKTNWILIYHWTLLSQVCFAFMKHVSVDTCRSRVPITLWHYRDIGWYTEHISSHSQMISVRIFPLVSLHLFGEIPYPQFQWLNYVLLSHMACLSELCI